MSAPLTPLKDLEQDLRARYLLDQGVAVDSFRRPNLPNAFPLRHWSRERPRVLYLIPHMNIGGAERVDLDILDGLRESGVWTTLVVERAEPREWADQFAEVVDEVVLLSRLAPSGDGARLLDHLVVSRNIDVVFIRNSAAGYGLAERWSAKSAGHVRFVDLLHVHNFGQDWCDYSASRDRFLHRRYVTNDDLRSYMRAQYGLVHGRFRRIYCGVDPSAFALDSSRAAEVRRELGIQQGQLIVGFVGRLDEQKNPILWLDSVARIAATSEDVHFVMVGDGPMGDEVRAHMSRLSCRNRIHLVGHSEDVARFLNSFDLLMMTSRYEGLPQCVFEAMAAGVPVVSSDAGGTRECVTDDVGVIVPLDSGPEVYEEAVLHLLADRQRLSGYRDRCRARIREHFDVRLMKVAYCAEVTALCGEVDREARRREYLDLHMQGKML